MKRIESPRNSRWLLWSFTGLILIALIGFFDYLTGYEISFSLFYLIPISLLGWFSGRPFGIAAAIISALVWLFAEMAAGQQYSHPMIRFWNSAIRLGFFMIVTFLLSTIHQMLEREKELSSTDFLTGALAPRLFQEILQNEIHRYNRQGRPFTLVYLDLDNFKFINDSFGHSVGDRVLYSVVLDIKNNLRKADIVARLGGDEFAILLIETDQHGAQTVISRVLQSLSAGMKKEGWPITFSVGAMTFNEPPKLSDEAIKLADDLMYLVKKGGKNSVRFSTYPESTYLL